MAGSSPKGKLGFHAPSLTVSNGNYDGKSISKSYNLALRTISDAIVEINLNKPRGYIGGTTIKFSLLAAMLNTPSSTMRYIDTVDDAGRWNVTIGPIDFDEPISDKNLARACLHAEQWDDDRSAKDTEKWLKSGGQYINLKAESDWNEYQVTIDEMTGDNCKFGVPPKHNTISKIEYVKINDEGFRKTPIIYYIDAKTPIKDLDP